MLDANASEAVRTSVLKVPGATIHYEVRGQGPLLLLIPGGPQDAGVFADLARHLADSYTVLAYDPRGNSRSAFDGDVQPLDVDVQADDAAALVTALGDGSAYVLGTSGGAQIGLNLAARYPHLVRTLVAHEPPAIMMLDDPGPALAADQELYEIYRRDGVEAAMGKFFADNALESAEEAPAFEMSPEEAETFARVSGNFEYWLAHGMMPLGRYVPDVGALRAGKPHIVIAIGEESRGQPIEAMGAALAKKLEVEPVAFPGDHMGFGPHAAAFADVLRKTLSAE